MKRKNADPTPKKSKRRLPCMVVVVLTGVCGAISLFILGAPAASRNRDATITAVARAATIRAYTPTSTSTPVPPSSTPTATATPSITATATPITPSNTPTATSTGTITETPIPPSDTPTATSTATATDTPVLPSNTPTATITNTATAQSRALPDMHITPLPHIPLMRVIQTANARSCPSRDCEILFVLETGETFGTDAIVLSEEVDGNDRWYQTKLGLTRQIAYVHSSLASEYDSAAPVQASTSAPAQAAPPAVARPANCAEAVAAGLTAEQAAQWDHLDRDGDGVACYGD